jgi:hypothetical protein
MRKLIFSAFLTIAFPVVAFAQTQSIIYDATAIMNAKHSLKALLIPNDNGFDIYDSKTGAKIETEQVKDSFGNVSEKIPNSLITEVNSDDIIIEILRRYTNHTIGTAPNVIMADFAANPFLKDILDLTVIKASSTDISSIGNTIAPPGVGGLGSNILGNLVNGTADFLIKRAQEEISVSIMEKLKQFLDKHPEFDILFPETCTLIRPIKAYDYNKALTAFKAAIKEDLSKIVSRVGKLYDLPKYKMLNKKIPALTLLFATSTALSEIEGDGGFANGLWVLSQQSYLLEQNNYASIMNLVGIVSNSLLDKKLSDPEDEPVKYINKDYIKLVTHKDPNLIALLSRVYLGLLWQKTSKIIFTVGHNKETMGNFLLRWNRDDIIGKALEGVDKGLTTYTKLNEEFKKIKEEELTSAMYAGTNSTHFKRIVYYSKVVSGGLGLCSMFIDPANPASSRINAIQQYLPRFTEGVANMLVEIKNEDYNLGLSRLEELLSVVSEFLEAYDGNKKHQKDAFVNLSNDFKAEIDARMTVLRNDSSNIHNLMKALPKVTGLPTDIAADADIIANTKEYREQLELIIKEMNDLDDQGKNKKEVLLHLTRVIKYVNLLAAISKAENSKAVEKLLETYALPAGSSRVKKVTTFNISLNAYVGAFGLRTDEMGKGFTNVYGFTAPIGVAISRGFGKVGSASLFVHLFDIGGTIKYKMENPDQYQQDISLGGIISPGIHAVYGFPWFLPLSIGAGYQWISPATHTSNDIKLKGTFNAFVGVDIPLFNLAKSKHNVK